jgi:hypothetical protein
MIALGPWFTRLIVVVFLFAVFEASPPLAATLVAGAALCALAIFLHQGGYIPRFVMDVLDRLTNRQQLERAYEARSHHLLTIDAADLARRIRSQVIGQDAAIESIATQLRRRIAARRPDKPLAVFCLSGAPGVGKTHFAKTLAAELYGNRSHLHFCTSST